MTFETVVIVDWSGGNDRGAKPTKDAIWACVARDGSVAEPVYFRNRQVFEPWFHELIAEEISAGRRVFAGFDFPFGYPQGFAKAVTGQNNPFALWRWLEGRIVDAPTTNNRFEVASELNALCEGVGPFWGNATKTDWTDLPRKGLARAGHGWPEKRQAEQLAKGAFTVWQLAGAGSVGSQTLMGLPVLERVRRAFGPRVSVWPLEPTETEAVLVEVWPSLLADHIAATLPEGEIKDRYQVRVLAQAISQLPEAAMLQMMAVTRTEEGWIFGLGHEATLKEATSLRPPPLRNDCFAMPQGAYWTPEADALAHLKTRLAGVKPIERRAVAECAGLFLAEDVTAERSHPPTPNSAVDGYAAKGPIPEGAHVLSLVDGRAAAGDPFEGVVPEGYALRILTGAAVPEGVDTVILQEDVNSDGVQITFFGPLKAGANARKAGEDMTAGEVIFAKGRKLTSADLGTLTAAGVAEIAVFERLRVGVLSTGDELRNADEPASEADIYDANRPMLLANIRRWGFEAVDLGRAPDDREALRKILDQASETCDAILTSGGASGGDEDHVSALLKDTGSFALWRIAIKPGRPLALGLWNEVPVFGLPGNPVAAQVCSLVFAHPALTVLAGGAWSQPAAFPLPANFSKSKKDGRVEYLRARVQEGRVHIFPSEGSGRISGLSWSTGLVRLPHEAMTVNEGDLVEFLPYATFQ